MKIEFKINLEPPRSWVRASVFLGAAVAVLGTAVAVVHADVKVPNVFTKQQPLSADQMNTNFQTLATAISTLQQEQLWSLNHAAAVAACAGRIKDASVGGTVTVISKANNASCTDSCAVNAGDAKKSYAGIGIANIRADQTTDPTQSVGALFAYGPDNTGGIAETGADYNAPGLKLYCCCY
jgi:hypothetical protein